MYHTAFRYLQPCPLSLIFDVIIKNEKGKIRNNKERAKSNKKRERKKNC